MIFLYKDESRSVFMWEKLYKNINFLYKNINSQKIMWPLIIIEPKQIVSHLPRVINTFFPLYWKINYFCDINVNL